MGKITAVVVGLNHGKVLAECIGNLESTNCISHLIVVDNGSDDIKTKEIVVNSAYDKIIFDEGTQNISKVWNCVINNFELDEIVLFVNPVARIDETVCNRIIAAFEDENVDIVGTSYVQQQLETGVESFETLGIDDVLVGIRKSALQEELFEEKLVSERTTVMDYEFRRWSKNKKTIALERLNVTCSAEKISYESLLDQDDRKIMKEKWGMNYFWITPNPFVPNLVIPGDNKEFSVLEIGCDMGANLVEIKRRYPKCKTYGVEINEQAAKIAGFINNVKMGDIQKLELPFDHKFDFILFSDVLEHLRNPKEVLEFCKEHLNENGKIIASIPNLMHVSVFQQLLAGRFIYTDMGLLDKTHIHFFTYHEIRVMFELAGFNVTGVQQSCVTITEEQKKLIDSLLTLSSNDVERHMFETYQYLVTAVVK